MNIEDFQQEFRRTYGRDPLLFRAPGRVNLIGEHTDYNDGFVLPAAIDFSTWVAIAKRDDAVVNIRSHAFHDSVSVTLDRVLQRQGKWHDYVVGVIDEILLSGKGLRGADILIHSEVPIGSGLSSSAAIEVASGIALLAANGYATDRKELALLCQRAENNFVGMRCGIMDQFVSCNGTRDHALMLDCRSLDFTLLPLSPASRLVICNTMVKHELASGEYNRRRQECEEGVRVLSSSIPGIKALRDVSLQQLDSHRDQLPEAIYRRCRHVITENDRVQKAASLLRQGDLSGFGKLMAQSHASLRDDYEVSCRELDIMVEIARRQTGVYGARMTGGGFGGCTVNLVSAENAESFRRTVAYDYQQAIGLKPDIYICSAADGAAQVQ